MLPAPSIETTSPTRSTVAEPVGVGLARAAREEARLDQHGGGALRQFGQVGGAVSSSVDDCPA